MLPETKVFTNRPMSPTLESVTEDVWLLRGDIKGGMNIYFVRDGDGVVQFDAGTSGMTRAAQVVGRKLGGVTRVVLGHGHCDHRGTAPAIGAPVHCHPDEVADTESDAPIPPYFDISKIEVAPVRMIYPAMLRHWDGGRVKVADTVSEGDDVAGFEVKHFPGHAPGLIGLWRESDRLALVSDTIYLVDSARLKPLDEGEASVPHPAFAWNHQMAKDSVRKLAALEPRVVCPGHEHPLRGENLHETLMRAAERYPEDARPN
jgi:glyoxylase-like metal-dependent hydrolase (beta-lactamase superfamily II)